ncbi:MAG: hypothetical protein KF858_03605 [Candidatus Sumerlaeia bacterium]|nr:hypothetical protein [Candidatus Sumerlaeia bacterium]
MKRRTSAARSGDGPPPPPVVPWRVPPMGSLGDAWDAVVVLPEAPKAGTAAPTPRKKRYRPGTMDVVFKDWAPSLHLAVIVAWVLLALALLSTGPAYPMMPYFAMGGFLAAAVATFLLRTHHRENSGEKAAWVAIALSLVLLALDAAAPARGIWAAHFTRVPTRPMAPMTFEAGIDRTLADMELVGKIAQCADVILGRSVVAEGREGVNSRLGGDSSYFRISTMARYDPESISPIEESYVFYTPQNLPKDPFADHPDAVYGVYMTNHWIIVTSAGPDRTWQLNPRYPVEDEEIEDPWEVLKDFAYQPASGPTGNGDLIVVLPRRVDSMEEVTLFTVEPCEEVRYLLLNRGVR